MPERYFAASLFAFKLFASAMIILLVLWQISLPNETWGGFDFTWFSTLEDYYAAASFMNGLCLVAGGVILIGGLFQLLKHSRRAGLWSLTFGGLILTVGIAYACYLSSIKPSDLDTLC